MAYPTCNPKKVLDSLKKSKFKSYLKLYGKVSIFCTAIIGVWVLFTVPVIVYNTQEIEKR